MECSVHLPRLHGLGSGTRVPNAITSTTWEGRAPSRISRWQTLNTDELVKAKICLELLGGHWQDFGDSVLWECWCVLGPQL